MASSFAIASKTIYIPTNDREFVEQASRSLSERLCLEPAEHSPYILFLEKDHSGIFAACQATLAKEKAKEKEPKPKAPLAWKATMIPLSIGVAAGAAHLFNLPMKTMVTIGAIVGVLLSFVVANTPEKNEFLTEIQIRATTERNWMKTKLAVVKERIATLETEIKPYKTVEDYEAHRDTFRERDQLMPLQSYLERATNRW